MTHSFPTRRSSDLMMFLQDMGMGLFRGGAASDEELADPFGDQRRLVLALDLERKFERPLALAGALFVEFNEPEMAAHPLARAEGGGEAGLGPKNGEEGKRVSVRVRLGVSPVLQKTEQS